MRKIKKNLFIVFLFGICFGQIIPDTLVTKSGKVYTGVYYNNDGYYTTFKYQKSTERTLIKTSDIENIILSDGKIIFGQKKPAVALTEEKKPTKIRSGMKNGLGLGLGLGDGGPSFSFSGLFTLKDNEHELQLFGHLGGSLIVNRSQDDTYDFSDELFNDPDRGESIEQVWLIGGTTIQMTNRLTVYVGGGITTIGRYLKRYDKFEILGDDGIYYIEDDDYEKQIPTFHFGVSGPIGSNALNLDYLGVYVNTNPINISLIGWIGY